MKSTSILTVFLILFSFNASASNFALTCTNAPDLVFPLLTANEADATRGTTAALLDHNGERLYLGQVYLGNKVLKLKSVEYCGPLLSSTPCSADVYTKGGSRFSSNMVFEFSNSLQSFIFTINKGFAEIDSNGFKAKTLTARDGIQKVECSISSL